MPGQVTLDEILSRNPRIDEEELEEARELLRQLRERGVRRKGYDLAPPFGGHRAAVRDARDNGTDPRLVRLRKPHQSE